MSKLNLTRADVLDLAALAFGTVAFVVTTALIIAAPSLLFGDPTAGDLTSLVHLATR